MPNRVVSRPVICYLAFGVVHAGAFGGNEVIGQD